VFGRCLVQTYPAQLFALQDLSAPVPQSAEKWAWAWHSLKSGMSTSAQLLRVKRNVAQGYDSLGRCAHGTHFLPTQAGVRKDSRSCAQSNSCSLTFAFSSDQCVGSILLLCKFSCPLNIDQLLPGVARYQNYETYRHLGTTLILLYICDDGILI
jgi:hypothetical protein